MPLNWLSNLNFKQESPMRWNTKDLKTQSNEIRELDRKRAIERAMVSGIDASGNLDQTKIRQSLIDQGFGESGEAVANEVTGKRMDQMEKETTAKQKALMMMIQGLITPKEFQARFGGSTSEVIETPTETPTPSSSTDWQTPSKEEIAQSVSTPISESDSTPKVEIPAKENEVVVSGDGFKSKAPELKLQDIKAPSAYETVQKKINPQVVPDYLASETVPDVSFFKPQSGKAGETESSGGTFTTESMTPEEKTNLERTLSRMGVSTAGKSLEKAYAELESKAIGSVPVPVYNPMAEKPGEEFGRYQRELAEYPSKVQAKRLELQEKIKSGYGEVQGLTLGKESQDFALAQQKNKDVFFRPVSPKEAETVYKIRNEYSDISNAGKSFEDAYQAALSVSKIDGSVSLDNILANLVAMKAFPSREAAQIRLLLDPKLDLKALTGNAFYNIVEKVTKDAGINIGTAKGASPEWINKTVKKYNEILAMNGGSPMGSVKAESTEAPKSGAVKEVEAAKARGEAKKPSAKKGFKPGSIW